MPAPSNDLPRLFESLKPNPEPEDNRRQAAARNAQSKWPLLKSVAPIAPPPGPALSEAEREHWHSATGTPALPSRDFASHSSPFTQALAQSLGKMSTWVPPAHPTTLSAPRESAPTQEPLPTQSPILNSTLPQDNVTEKPVASPPPTERPSSFLAEPPASAKNSLASVFSRIEGKTQPPPLPEPTKPSSFMSRIGKR